MSTGSIASQTLHSTTERYSHLIPATIAQQLLQESAAAEARGSLTVNQLAIIYKENWFKLFVPKQLHGLELSLIEGVEMEEALAYLDGSLGWTVTLCAGASFFVGYLNPAIAHEVFGNKQVCFAGSGQPNGTAVMTNFGYQINGHWQYASGAAHATIFTANCYIERDGQAVTNAEGLPIIQAFYFTREEVDVVETWKTTGLMATSGYAFTVQDLFVPKTRAFSINIEAATIGHPVYRFPFLQFAEATIAANTLGMTFRFLDLCQQNFHERDAASNSKNLLNKNQDNNAAKLEPADSIENSNAANDATDFADIDQYTIPPALNTESIKRWELLVAASDALTAKRVQFYTAIQTAWDELILDNKITADSLQEISAVAISMVAEARSHINVLYPHCGLIAADPRTDINRVWRDIHTASQHSLLK